MSVPLEQRVDWWVFAQLNEWAPLSLISDALHRMGIDPSESIDEWMNEAHHAAGVELLPNDRQIIYCSCGDVFDGTVHSSSVEHFDHRRSVWPVNE